MNFSDKLRCLIEERGLTQKRVANDLNIAPSTMGGYVQGSSEPDFETLKRLAYYFDVSTDYLLNVKSSNCNSFSEDELLRVFRSMTSEQQKLYIEQGKVFVRANASNIENKKSS
ncbi:MAG: helix-turn-helix domain-containing protein [Eubacterium sp.]